MHSGSDPLAAPPSFTARRSAASNLPNFELPPPPLSHLNHKFQQFATINTLQPTPVSSVTSVGNLLTPPSTHQGDGGLSPLSSGVTSGSSTSGQAIPPYTPNGYWPQGPGPSYGYPTGTTPQGIFPPRGLFSPSSLNSIMRNSNGSSSADGLPPPPPYDLNQLPPFPTSLSMSGPSSLPTLHAQHHTMNSSYMNGQNQGSALPPPPQHSPHQAQDHFQQARAPPTPTSYYGNQHTHSHSSSGAQQFSNNPYGSRPSSQQTSPVTTSGPMGHMSPQNGNGEIPSLQSSTSQSPYQYQRPYGTQPLPAMNGAGMPGPVMSNLHSPGSQMALVGSMTNGMMSGFNSGHAAHMQQSMYALHNSSQQPQQQANERPFKCDQCVQSFNRNHDLKRHKRIHLAVKPFPCGHCDKSFSRKDALKRHILVKGCGKAIADDSQQHDGSESPTAKSDRSDPSSGSLTANTSGQIEA